MSPSSRCSSGIRRFAGLEAVVADTEQVVPRSGARGVGQERVVRGRWSMFRLGRPFPRITVRDAFREPAGIADAVDLAHSDEARYFELLVARVGPGLARESKPLFLWQYPAVSRVSAPLAAIRSMHSASSCTWAESSCATASMSSPIRASSGSFEQDQCAPTRTRPTAYPSTNASRGAAGGHAPFRRQRDRFRSPGDARDRGRELAEVLAFPAACAEQPSACPAYCRSAAR